MLVLKEEPSELSNKWNVLRLLCTRIQMSECVVSLLIFAPARTDMCAFITVVTFLCVFTHSDSVHVNPVAGC